MNRELRDKWTAALRSGEYAQATGTLYREIAPAYCCLGVLCVVAGLPREDIEGYSTLGKIDRLGMLNSDINIADNLETQLVSMNDSPGYPFSKIADWIEQNIPVEEAA